MPVRDVAGGIAPSTARPGWGTDRDALTALHWRWGLTAAVWSIGVLLTERALAPSWPASGRWAITACAVSAGMLWLLWRWLPDNRRDPDTYLLSRFGPGTRLTLARAALVAATGGFLAAPPPPGMLAWIPALVFGIAVGSDYFDGRLARRSGQITQLGERLDLELDGLAVFLGTLLAVRYGQLPWWLLPVSFARPLFVVGLWWRRCQRQTVRPLPPSNRRRALAGIQMGGVAGSLWPMVSPPLAATVVTVFTGATLLGFVRDWLVVSDRIDPASATGHVLAARGESPAAFGRRDTPPGGVARRSHTPGILAPRAWPAGRLAALGATRDFHYGLLVSHGVLRMADRLARVTMAITVPIVLLGAVVNPEGWATVLAGWGWRAPEVWARVTVGACVLALPAMLVGYVTIPAALVLFFALNAQIAVEGPSVIAALAAAGTATSLLAGAVSDRRFDVPEVWPVERAGQAGGR